MPYLGNIEYYIPNDGYALVDGGGAFGLVPRPVWERLIAPDEENRIPFSLNSLLIRSEGKTILVDTGYGSKLSEKDRQRVGLRRPEGDLVAQLARLGVQPDEVDIVVDTHLHADHCAGNTRLQGDTLVPTFPKAEYYIQRLEWTDAIARGQPTSPTIMYLCKKAAT